MLRAIIGTVVGYVVGSIVNLAIIMVNAALYPAPEGLDMFAMDPESQKAQGEFINSLPALSFIIAWVAHWGGAFVGSLVATLIAGRRSYIPAIIISVLFTLGGLYIITQVASGPPWFPFLDLPSYLIFGLLAARLVMRKDDGAK